MLVRTGFLTTNRYTRLVGLMTPVMTALLKPHIARLNGSSGSGTDLGSTTVTGGELVVTNPCAGADAAQPSARTTSAKFRTGQPWMIFNIPTCFAKSQKSWCGTPALLFGAAE